MVMTQITTKCDHPPRARHPGMQVKWALGSITMNKASRGDGILAELFQILKDDAVKVLYSICQKIWKTQQCYRTGKDQFSFQSLRRAMQRMFKLLRMFKLQLPLFHMLAK